MGLDMYAYLAKKNLNDSFIAKVESVTDKDFMYWRKNRHLHGWMESLYEKKCKKANIKPEEFNCIPMILTKEDIFHLIFDIKNDRMHDAEGFFWGERDYDENQMLQDLEFCARALQAMEDDNTVVVYDSWW